MEQRVQRVVAASGALCLLLLVRQTASVSVGWGFVKHGGFPVNPWASWQMNHSTTAYFVGNASGMDSKAELDGEVRLGYVGIGWQLDNIPSHYSNLEKYEIEEAKILKELRPDVRVSVLRNSEVATVFWNTAREKMYDPAAQDWWTQCPDKENPGKMAPCVGSWGSPAGNTPKYWFNFSNPQLVDWWVGTYIGEAVNNSLFDGVYFDCCCGKPPGVTDAKAAKFQADSQAAFDRALALIKKANKWASAWNSDGTITAPTCAATMKKWIAKGANPAISLQPLAPAFFHKRPAPPSPPPLPPSECGETCRITKGMDTFNRGIVAPPVAMPKQDAIDAPENVAECCSRCKANSKCEVFEIGHGGCVGTQCNASTINCFIIGGFTGKMKPNKDRVTGCIRAGAPPAPPPHGNSIEIDQNNTVAAFMLARGESAMLELPVAGAYEAMSGYDVDATVLQLDFGAAVGVAEEANGVFTRKFAKGTIHLDCNKWQSSFVQINKHDD